MASLPEPLENLIGTLSRLPGIGPRSAERIALHIVQSDPVQVGFLAQALVAARERVKTCATCGALTERDPCSICSDPKREASLVCAVERPVDVISIS